MRIPPRFYTASARFDRDGALAAGFDAHLVKPVDPRQLQDVLDSQVLTCG